MSYKDHKPTTNRRKPPTTMPYNSTTAAPYIEPTAPNPNWYEPCPNCQGSQYDGRFYDNECRECRGTDGWLPKPEHPTAPPHTYPCII